MRHPALPVSSRKSSPSIESANISPVPILPTRDQSEVFQDTARHGEALMHSALARLTCGISPASVLEAYTDWWMHLLGSPSKQAELGEKFVRKMSRFAQYLTLCTAEDASCIEPLPQDKRFSNPAWKLQPFASLAQLFLLTQQWWWNATTGIRGVSKHHEQMVTFGIRQFLDTLSPSNFPFTNPEVLRRTVETNGTNLIWGYHNWWRDYSGLLAHKPPVGTDAFRPGVNVAITPGKVIWRNQLVELIQYDPVTPKVGAEPVFIVPSWIMKYYILDLSPANSMVRYLVEQGHSVFIVSWRNPTSSDRNLGMQDYLDQGVLEPLQQVRAACGRERVHAVGYCLGGTLLAIAAAYLAQCGEDALQSLSLLAAQLDFEEPGELGLFIDESQIAYLENIMSEQGYLDGAQMAGAFALINSKDLVWSKLTHEYLMGRDPAVNDMRAWNADATRLPYRMHSEYLRQLYLGNDLAEGRYQVRGKVIALKDLRVPLFVVATEADHVSPWRSVYKTHMLTDSELTFVLVSGGHNVGIVCPPKAPVNAHFRTQTRGSTGQYQDADTWFGSAQDHSGSWWPFWSRWLEERTKKTVAAASRKPSTKASIMAPGRYVIGQ